MLIAGRAWVLMLIASVLSGGFQFLGQTPKVVTCRQATRTKPEVGDAYRGAVTNDDYKLFVTVPKGYTGWGGGAANAPFHGFTIFLDQSLRSCLLFEVHIRVDEADAPRHLHSAKALSLGQARAWQTSSRVTAKGGEIMNLKTIFTFHHDGETDDGQVTLIAPASEQRKTKSVYDNFLKSVHFGGN